MLKTACLVPHGLPDLLFRKPQSHVVSHGHCRQIHTVRTMILRATRNPTKTAIGKPPPKRQPESVSRIGRYGKGGWQAKVRKPTLHCHPQKIIVVTWPRCNHDARTSTEVFTTGSQGQIVFVAAAGYLSCLGSGILVAGCKVPSGMEFAMAARKGVRSSHSNVRHCRCSRFEKMLSRP
jgi:hypothetical protein